MKSILKFAVVLVIGILVYNFFYGTPEEKKQAGEIKDAIVNVGKISFSLIKDEYQKFKDGKYDKALDQVGDLLKDAKEKGGAIVEDIKEWEEKKQVWKKKKEELIEFIENNPDNVTEKQKEQLKELEEESKALEIEGEKLKQKADQQE